MNIIDSLAILGSQSQSATTTSTAYALTAGTTVLVTNEGATNILRVAFGSSTVAATANSTSIPINSARQFSVRNGETFIALKTDAATTGVNITTGEGVSSC